MNERDSLAAVRLAFERAAPTYDSAAELQRRVCARLLGHLPQAAPARLLDAGSGTGYGTRGLLARWPDAQVVAADFAPAMLRQARAAPGPGAAAVAADIQALPLAEGSVDGYFSSLAVQWCDPERVCREAARVLRPGGWLALATLGPGSLLELRDAFAGLDGHDHVLAFREPAVLIGALARHGFTLVLEERRQVQLLRPDLAAILRELKTLGANGVGANRRRGFMGKKLWARVVQRYEARRLPGGLPVSYDVLYLLARRKEP